MRANATLEYKQEVGCDPRRRRKMFTAWRQPFEGCWVPSVHACCSCNERAALLLRSLGDTPASVDSGRARVRRTFDWFVRVARRYSGETWSHLDTAYSYTGALRGRYLEAERSLREDGPVTLSDSYLRAFLKAEKVNSRNKFPKPRMIYPRSPRYNLDLASRLKPFEHWLWRNLKYKGHSFVSRIAAKGLNQQQRARLVREKMARIPGCVVAEVDGKAFEAHVEKYQLEQEHRVYAAAFPGDLGLSRLLQRQLELTGVTTSGIKFSREGGRASGDYNTGMGNTMVFLAVVISALESMSLGNFDILADGDNCLLFLEPGDSSYVQREFYNVALEAGHEMVLESPCDCVEKVRFGQSAPCELAPGLYVMVRDWRKILSHATSDHRHMRDLPYAKRWLRGVALCEAYLARGVPIVWKYAKLLLAATEGSEPLPLDRYPEYKERGVVEGAYSNPRIVEPTELARESYSRAWDTPISLQEKVESVMGLGALSSTWTPAEPPLPERWWDCDPGYCEFD